MAHLGAKMCFQVAVLPANRAAPAAETDWKTLFGTQTGFTIDGEDFTADTTFGCGENVDGTWATSKIVGRSWTSDFSGYMEINNPAQEIVFPAGMEIDEQAQVWVRWYPFGKVTGAPYYRGIANVKTTNPSGTSTATVDFTMNFTGDGQLFREPVPAPPATP